MQNATTLKARNLGEYEPVVDGLRSLLARYRATTVVRPSRGFKTDRPGAFNALRWSSE